MIKLVVAKNFEGAIFVTVMSNIPPQPFASKNQIFQLN